MKPFLVNPAIAVKGWIEFPGDKSIAHRAIILSALSASKTIIRNFPSNQDCLSTINVFRQLGIKIIDRPDKENTGSRVVMVFGKGLLGLEKPAKPVFIAESGTTFRLLLGVLAGQDFKVTLKAGKPLCCRPMLRVTAPLRKMGAEISAKRKAKNAKLEEYPPITIKGSRLKPLTCKMPIASAQVKSAILIAGLYAKGKTVVIEPAKSRDHTEQMLKLFKADIKVKGNKVAVSAAKKLVSPKEIYIPGDISSAAFFIVLGLICKNSRILIKNIGLNPSRSGIIKVLKSMGANIQVPGAGRRVPGAEPIGNITVNSSELKGVTVKKQEIPSLIDELPVLMVAACFARGRTVFKGVKELRVKETDRINSMLEGLKKMGADIRVEKTAGSEDVIVNGKGRLRGASVKSHGDHRTAMSLVIAGLAASGNTRIDDVNCINKSFPDFLVYLRMVAKPTAR